MHNFLLMFILFFASQACLAEDLNQKIERVINKINNEASTNATKGSFFNSQASGGYQAGNLFVRSENPALGGKLFIQPPTFNGDCGNFDMSMGGFSFLKGDEMMKVAKAVPSMAGIYALKLGLKTVSPMLESVIEQVMGLAMELGADGMDACRISKLMVDTALTKTIGRSQESCINSQTANGKGKDFYDAQKYCKDKDKAKEKADEDEQNETNINLVWEAFRKSKRLKNVSDEEKELVMSLLGTLVLKTPDKSDSEIEKWYESLISADKYIEFLTKGGTYEGYVCSDYKEGAKGGCLQLTITKKQITTPINQKVSNIINSIRSKIQNEKIDGSDVQLQLDEIFDEESSSESEKQSKIENLFKKVKESEEGVITSEELALIEVSSIPIYRILNVISGLPEKSFDLSPYIDLIAIDYFTRLYSEVLDVVNALDLESSKWNLYAERIKIIREAGTKVEAALAKKQQEHILLRKDLIERLEYFQKYIKEMIAQD